MHLSVVFISQLNDLRVQVFACLLTSTLSLMAFNYITEHSTSRKLAFDNCDAILFSKLLFAEVNTPGAEINFFV